MSVMSGVFLDEMQEDPAQCHGLAIPATNRDLIQGFVGPRDLAAGRDGVVQVGDFAADFLVRVLRQRIEAVVVPVGVVPGAVEIRGFVAGEDLGEPIPLDLREMAQQTTQAQGRGRNGLPSQLLRAEPGAFGLRGRSMEIQPHFHGTSLGVSEGRIGAFGNVERGNLVRASTLHSPPETRGPCHHKKSERSPRLLLTPEISRQILRK